MYDFSPKTASAQLALDTILQKPTGGIPVWLIHIMEHSIIERIAGVAPGDYLKNPEPVYLQMEKNLGVCVLDQYLWDNPLTMGRQGYEGGPRSATTGIEEIVVDGMRIDSPEAVVEHMEKFVFPALEKQAAEFDEDARTQQAIDRQSALQERLGRDILATGYAFVSFPGLSYGRYGYVNYFSAYALYPEVMAKHFALQAEVCIRNNRAAARAYATTNMPRLHRLDHDMADSRGTLVRMESLDEIWFPHFARCIEPLVKEGVRLIWHCDGNLMQMVPRLIECGVKGFQGFQYEDGMDYEKICRMKTRDGEELIIFAGSSVTRTLPMGTPADVKRELEWLVEKGPKTGLVLGCSSSVAPGVPWDNIKMLWDGLRYYKEHGRV